MLILAFFAVGCASLKYAGAMWWTVWSTATFVCVAAAAVVTIVERGGRQAFAGGFAVCFCLYFALTVIGGTREVIPTSRLLSQLRPMIATPMYIDVQTGQVIADHDPQNSNRMVIVDYKGDQYKFRDIGHLLFGIAIGYLGARFATFVYQRRMAREAAGTRTS